MRNISENKHFTSIRFTKMKSLGNTVLVRRV